MFPMMPELLLILAAYLIGSLSSAVLVCRLAGLPDPRSEGSGNPGTTNVLRIGGKVPAAATLAGDFLKGLGPVLIVGWMSQDQAVLGAVAVAAVLGHLYPLYFRFQGGKGVATGLGCLFGLSLWVGLAALATWLVIAALFRISSLAALVSALLSPLYVWAFGLGWELMVAAW